ncbi:MAG: hypothetical protein ACLSIH_10840 [Eggerthella lenta]
MDHAVDLDVNLAPIAHVVRASAGFEALVERLLGADVSALLVDDAARANAVAAALAARDEQGEVVLVPRAGEARRACLRARRPLPASGARSSTSWRTRTRTPRRWKRCWETWRYRRRRRGVRRMRAGRRAL